jgi:membrane protein
LLLVLGAAGGVWRAEPVRDEIVHQIDGLIGREGASVVAVVMEERAAPPESAGAAWFGLGMLLLGSTTVFAQLQYSLNRVWRVRVRRSEQLWHIVRIRLLSLGLIFGAGFVLLVSLVVSSAVSLRESRLELSGSPWLWQSASFAASLVVFTVVFAMIFKMLPDVRIAWRDVWVGAALTSVLFGTGKELMGIYLGRSLLASAYGAAGSLVVLLLWVYFASILLLGGAEFTQVFAHVRGRSTEPKPHAEPVR